MLVKQNGPEKFHGWEEEFRDVHAYLSSLEPPKYPYPIDAPLAERGKAAFNRVCSQCHGEYGANRNYPERLVPIDEVGTDRVRLDALTPKHRAAYGESWFAHYGKLKNLDDPGGYVAPPLDGVWASAPYFHNGSVPTLWHVLHSDERPVVWKRSPTAYDNSRLGPKIEMFSELPANATAGWQKREYFDTRAFGKSAAGHDFPEVLTEAEKRAVLEYLKTL
jgi:mono/diheme cytochrome c family protein